MASENVNHTIPNEDTLLSMRRSDFSDEDWKNQSFNSGISLRSWGSAISFDHASGLSAVSDASSIAFDKSQNKPYLNKKARSKFQRGMQYLKKKQYSKAQSRFQAALEARILLHEDVQHLSMAPIHEMISMTDRKLGQLEKSRIHLLAALEICEVALHKTEGAEERGQLSEEEDNAEMRNKNESCVNRSKPSMNEAKQQKEGGNSNSLSNTRQNLMANIIRIKRSIEVIEHKRGEKEANEKKMRNKTIPEGTGGFFVGHKSGGNDITTDAGSAALEVKDGMHGEDIQIKAWANALKLPDDAHKSVRESVVKRWQQKEERRRSKLHIPKHIEVEDRGNSDISDIGNSCVFDEEGDGTSGLFFRLHSVRENDPDNADEDGPKSFDKEGDISVSLSRLGSITEDVSPMKAGDDTEIEAEDGHQHQSSKRNNDETGQHSCITRPSKNAPPSSETLPLSSRMCLKRMNTRDQACLRATYREHTEKGQEYFEAEQYVMALASFNDAKFALLLIAGMPDERYSCRDPSIIAYSRLRDKINSALLSERITDCHVEEFFRLRASRLDEGTEDFSHVNYQQAAKMLTGTKDELIEKIKLRSQIDIEASTNLSEKDKSPGEEELNHLIEETSLSLARIYSKQGLVHAKLDYHHMALNLFGDAIAALEEASGNKEQQVDTQFLGPINDDTLLLKTYDVISSNCKDTLNLPCTNSLENSSHIDALAMGLLMASSHSALGLQGVADGEDLYVALNHHLHASKLAQEARRLRVAFGESKAQAVVDDEHTPRRLTVRSGDLSILTSIEQASVVEDDLQRTRTRGLTVRGSHLSILTWLNKSPKKMSDDMGSFEQMCELLKAHEEICICHASFALGLQEISIEWLMKFSASVADLDLSAASKEAGAAMDILSAIMIIDNSFSSLGKNEKSNLAYVFSFQEGDEEATLTADEKPRLMIHAAMALLENGSYDDALNMFQQATPDHLYESVQPPAHPDEILLAIAGKIILEVKQGNMARAAVEMNRRLSVVSRWRGHQSIEMAKNVNQLACIQSVMGNNEKCVEIIEESRQIVSKHSCTLESMKLLATAYYALNDEEKALSEYKRALMKETNLLDKARMMNAIAHLYIRAEGQFNLALKYLEKSLGIQKDAGNSEGIEEIDLAMHTMILYGNAMASTGSFSEAIRWFQSALDLSPSESPMHINSLRAWYDKGVSLYRNGDNVEAGHVFGNILNKVGKNFARSHEASSALHTIGIIYLASLHALRLMLDEARKSPTGGTATALDTVWSTYFSKMDYRRVIRRFRKFLSLKVDRYFMFQDGALHDFAMAYYNKHEYDESGNESANTNHLPFKAAEQKDSLNQSNIFLTATNLFSELWMGGTHSDNHLENHKSEIPMACDDNTTSYSDDVYSPKQKLLTALGVEAVNLGAIALSSGNNRSICEAALKYLLEQTDVWRAAYSLELKESLTDKLNSKFMSMKSILDTEYQRH